MKALRPLFTFLALTALASPILQGQFVKVWENTAGTTGSFWWLTKTDYNATSLAYNQATGHLLVARRNDRIYVLDASNGNLLDSLNNAGTTGTFRFNMMRASSDGAIYALSLATGASATYTIYRWANETAAPTQAIVTYVGARTGDSFGISGSGTSTVLFNSGTGNTWIYVFTTTDGVNFTKTDSIPVTTSEARGGVSPVTTGTNSDLWINGAATPTRKISSTGTILATPVNTAGGGLPNDSIHTAWHKILYFQKGASKFLAVVGRNDPTYGKIMAVYDITTSETNPTLNSYVELSNIFNTNLNATGDAAVKDNGDGSVTLFQLVTNNGVAAWHSVLAPATPQLAAPANNSTNQQLSPTLRWRPSVTATSYHLQVGTDSSYASPSVNDSTIADTSKSIGPLSDTTKYFWRVRCKNAAGYSAWSYSWNFTTGISLPAIPDLASPSSGAKGQPLNVVLRWRATLHAASYRVQVGTDSGFASPIINDSTVRDTLKGMSGLSINTKYYWRVNAKNAGGTSAYSTIWNFTTGTQAGVADAATLPHQFMLQQNYPNPFNPVTTIPFTIPDRAFVSFKVFDILGQEVATLVHEERSAGSYNVQWDASAISSGIYFYKLVAGPFSETKKLVFSK